MRAIAYLRYSSEEQAAGHSLDAQRHDTHAFIRQRGWTLIQDYVDAGISAKAGSQRPALQELLEDAEIGHFDVVVVHKVDRFYRDLKELLTALERLQAVDVSFVSVKENIDFSTPWGKIALTILGILAEIYLDNLSQETRKGKRSRARKGLWNGTIPFGYCRGTCSTCDDPNGPGYCPHVGQEDRSPDRNQLIPHPIEAQAVRWAFEWYATGDSSDADIAGRLNKARAELPDGSAQVFRTKGQPGRSPNPISKDAVRTMLNRRFYTGRVPYYGVDESGKKRRRGNAKAWYDGQHPALITDEQFEIVQTLRQQATYRTTKGDDYHPLAAHPLSGILVCDRCGKPLRATTTGQGYRYYRDATRIEKTGQCPQPNLRAEEIEAQVVAYLRDCAHSLPTDWRKQMAAHWNEAHPQAAEQAQAAKAKLERATELYLEGLIEKQQVEDQQLTYQLARAHLRPSEFDDIIAVGKLLERFDDRWSDATLPKRNGLLRLTLETAHIRDKSLVALQPKVAFLTLGAICRCGSDGTCPIQH